MPPLEGTTLCFTHSPQAGAARAKARKLGGQRKATPKLSLVPDSAPQLRSVAAIQEQLEAVYWDTQAQANGAPRTRALAALLTLALETLRVGELEERLAQVEAHAFKQPRRMA